MIYNYENLPTHDNINRYSYCIEVSQQLFVQKGNTIAYYGSLRFEALSSSVVNAMVLEAFNAPLYLANYTVVTGTGKLILADCGNDVSGFNLDNNYLTVKSSHVLGFEPTLTCKQSVLPGYLTFKGSGQLIASSNGPVHLVEPPVWVDEQALVGWSDVLTPSYHYDYHYVRRAIATMGGFTTPALSGEEQQIEFTGEGKVLIQSSEGAIPIPGIV